MDSGIKSRQSKHFPWVMLINDLFRCLFQLVAIIFGNCKRIIEQNHCMDACPADTADVSYFTGHFHTIACLCINLRRCIRNRS